MKITLRQLVTSVNAAKLLVAKEMPVLTAYRLSKLVRTANEELRVYQETCQLLNERAQALDEASRAQWLEDEHNKLLEAEVELPDTAVTLKDLERCSVSPQMLLELDWLVRE